MVICQRRSTWFWPKKNLNNSRQFTVLKGKLFVACINDTGESIINSVILDSQKNNYIFRVAPNVFHVDFPLTDIAIHLETTDSTPDPHIFLKNTALNRKNFRHAMLKEYRLQNLKSLF